MFSAVPFRPGYVTEADFGDITLECVGVMTQVNQEFDCDFADIH
jgi:hypothetical protein